METILIGLGVNILTWISKKMGLSATVISIIVSFVGGSIYYVMTNYYGVTWEKVAQLALGVYASSQVIYNLYKKFILKQ